MILTYRLRGLLGHKCPGNPLLFVQLRPYITYQKELLTKLFNFYLKNHKGNLGLSYIS